MKDITITFTREELQLLYAACMGCGDKFAELAKSIPNEEEIGDYLIVKAKQTWKLAGKVIKYRRGINDYRFVGSSMTVASKQTSHYG